VISIKSRKVGLSTLVCAPRRLTARIRDVNAAVTCSPTVRTRAGATAGAQARLRRFAPVLRLPLARETSTVLAYEAGRDDSRSLKAFPATPTAAIEATTSHLVLDEWAHSFDPEALWVALEPTLPARASSP